MNNFLTTCQEGRHYLACVSFEFKSWQKCEAKYVPLLGTGFLSIQTIYTWKATKHSIMTHCFHCSRTPCQKHSYSKGFADKAEMTTTHFSCHILCCWSLVHSSYTKLAIFVLFKHKSIFSSFLLQEITVQFTVGMQFTSTKYNVTSSRCPKKGLHNLCRRCNQF